MGTHISDTLALRWEIYYVHPQSDCVTFPVPLITVFIATVDDTLTWGGGRAVKRDSET